MYFRKHFLFFTLLPLLLLSIAASYYRFSVLEDYRVAYEVDCDPETSSCYIGCEDDECTEVYYYNYIQRDADTIMNLCGPDITDCDAAAACGNDEPNCSIEFCSVDEECDLIFDTNDFSDEFEELRVSNQNQP